jgi:hypothetical protein
VVAQEVGIFADRELGGLGGEELECLGSCLLVGVCVWLFEVEGVGVEYVRERGGMSGRRRVIPLLLF